MRTLSVLMIILGVTAFIAGCLGATHQFWLAVIALVVGLTIYPKEESHA